MPITTNESVVFNIANIQDNQILVYDAATGSFVNENSVLSANANITGEGRNVGSSGIGIYKQNDQQYLEFYKIQAGPNATISLSDNVITIDSVVGSGVVSSVANADSIAVYDTNGNVISGDSSFTYDGSTVFLVGANSNISFSDGTITANTIIVDNIETTAFSLPTNDGTANQILVTDGNGSTAWADNINISGKLDSLIFNAHVAAAITTTANHAPALHNLYSLGNATNKYSQVFATYFRGTADLAVNAQNLGSQPAANYMLRSDTYNADQIEALIANVSANVDLSNYITNISVTDGNVSYQGTTVDIRSADDNIIVSADPVTKTITLTSNVTQNKFTRIAANGNVSNYIVADRPDDVLNFVGGTGIEVTADPNSDTITIRSTGSSAANISSSSISDLIDVGSVVGIQDGQALLWSSSTNQFEAGNIAAQSVSTSLIVGTRVNPVDVTLNNGDSFNVLSRTGNIQVNLS